MGVLNEYAGVSEETTAMMPNALAKADETIDAANAKAAKRQKIEALKMKRGNLVKRNEYLQGQLKQFNDLTDDQIYAMARTKGIKDEDVKGLINARNSQRGYEINKEGLELSKLQTASNEAAKKASEAATKATEDAAAASQKKQDIKDKRKELLEIERDLTKIVNTKVKQEEIAPARAEFDRLMNLYNDSVEEYAELTNSGWNVKEFEFGHEDEEGDLPNVGTNLPEGAEKWDEADKVKFTRPETTETEREEIKAKYLQKKINKGKADVEKQKRINDNTAAGKAAASYLSAKKYAKALAKDVKGKTYIDFMSDWGWNNNTKQKKAK